MTKDEIIALGIQAGLCDEFGDINLEYDYKDQILAFAKLVADTHLHAEEIERRIQRTRTRWVSVEKPQDEIMEMAKQAGFMQHLGVICIPNVQNLEDFATQVAEKEREACAKVCEKHADVYAGLEKSPTTQSAWAACIDSRDSIRARGGFKW